jgi:ribose 5-phosphate isomerase A
LIKEPVILCKELDSIPGLVGHGLFAGLAKEAFIAGETGVSIIA